MSEYTIEQCKRKINQHHEMAALARVDGDMVDCRDHMEQVKVWTERLGELQ